MKNKLALLILILSIISGSYADNELAGFKYWGRQEQKQLRSTLNPDGSSTQHTFIDGGSITFPNDLAKESKQDSVQAAAGSNASKANAVQGIEGGKPIEVDEPTLETIYNRLNDIYARISPVFSAQSGTWTVQPGNIANTTAWKVDGSAVTQPVSAVSLPLPSNAATETKQDTIITRLSPSSTGPDNFTKTVPTGSAEAIVSVPVSATRGVLVSSDSENNATVYVGGSSVTTANGVELTPGDSRFYEVDNANLIYCISSSASQVLRIEVL